MKITVKALPAALVVVMALAVLLPLGVSMAAQGKAKAGIKVPAEVELNYIDGRMGSVKFNHEMHAGIAGQCGKCHHQHEAEAGKGCMDCHKLGPDKFKSSVESGFLACSSCHGQQSADAPGMPGLQVALHRQCFNCHVGMAELGASPKACTQTCHTGK